MEARLPDTAHTDRPWRIHEIAPEFELEDVWALPTPGGRDDFGRLVAGFAESDPAQSPSAVVRALFAIRFKVGDLLGWDDDSGSPAPSLRDRLPQDLLDRPGPEFSGIGFRSLYLLDDEWAAELANRTMHGVLHLGWVPDGADRYRGQLAILVKRNGLLGSAYMAAIRPFRHTLVYPAMIKNIGRRWERTPLS